MSKYSVGIDLGTTYSCVGIWQNGKVEIIANDQGERTTPSIVAFNKSERLVGDSAKNQLSYNSTNTIFGAKRLLGKKFADPEVQSIIKHWPFKVVDDNSNSEFQVMFKEETIYVSPEEISGAVLSKMKQIASDYLGEEITEAVITVPAYFNDDQRQATKNAGKIAGLNILRIINEPTAAALAYGLDKISKNKSNILVYDFGGGTLDCTVLSIIDGIFEVKATSGNNYLGGDDIDIKLVEYCIDEFKRKNKIDLTEIPKAVQRIRISCEKAKRTLSGVISTTIEIDSIYDGIDLVISLSRAKLESICSDIFIKALEPVHRVMLDSGINKTQIDEIILVGGSTRIPKIKQLLTEYFGKKPNESVNPDEAVAYGATIQAAILSGIINEQLDQLVLLDVTPLSLGLETAGGLMTNIIDRNTTIPCKRYKTFTTYSDNQQNVNVQIYEGERKFAKDNNNLGTFRLEGIMPATRGTPQIEVTFELDANGILNVMAHDKASNKKNNLTITNNKNRISPEDIERMILDAKKFETEDYTKRSNIEAKNELENYVNNVKQALSEPKILSAIGLEDKIIIEELCCKIIRYIDEGPIEKVISDLKRKELDEIWNPIIMKIYNK